MSTGKVTCCYINVKLKDMNHSILKGLGLSDASLHSEHSLVCTCVSNITLCNTGARSNFSNLYSLSKHELAVNYLGGFYLFIIILGNLVVGSLSGVVGSHFSVGYSCRRNVIYADYVTANVSIEGDVGAAVYLRCVIRIDGVVTGLKSDLIPVCGVVVAVVGGVVSLGEAGEDNALVLCDFLLGVSLLPSCCLVFVFYGVLESSTTDSEGGIRLYAVGIGLLKFPS